MQPLFEVLYHPDVSTKDLPRIAKDVQKRIKKAIETKLAHAPEEFGEPLRRTLKGYWKLRVGDWRVIYKVEEQKVLILRIGHRREMYER